MNIHKADFINMNFMSSEIYWDLLHNQCPDDPDGSLFVEPFCLTVLLVCCICSPNKLSDQQRLKTEHYRKIYVLNRKRRKLNCQLKALKDINPQSPKNTKIEEEINLFHFHFYVKEAQCAEQKH